MKCDDLNFYGLSDWFNILSLCFIMRIMGLGIWDCFY